MYKGLILQTGRQDRTSFVAGGDKFTLVDLLQCVPSIQSLNISNYYMKYLCSGCMPHKLPTTLVHLKALSLDVCFTEQNEISSALCMIMSSPVLERIIFKMCDNEKLSIRQTPIKIVIMDLVKLIMAKSPMLKNVRIELNKLVSVNEELKMLRDLLQIPFPRASPSAKLTFVSPNFVD
ncbi:F-box/FBD/LRR-repeat protein At1g13570-like [Bidens hawaiensis]|uniref:F-box/FBD/LRR-repeat protein At1g13570-like n=1 Tax=Bidens hawaiensis TaxID=980011 RepID=UPI00404913C3